VRKALRPAWEIDDADKAERLLRNLARRARRRGARRRPSILEGVEMLTVNRFSLLPQLRRPLACTNSIENMMRTVRRVCRKVKRCARSRHRDTIRNRLEENRQAA
jgi:putative transposase